jgi:hypothetical protein
MSTAIDRQRAAHLRNGAYPCERCSIGWHELLWFRTEETHRRIAPAYFDDCAICGLNGSPRPGIGGMTFTLGERK